MKTKQVYYEDSYKSEIEAKILEIQENGDGLIANIILSQTVFYPEGGGQPGDQGSIIGKNGQAKVISTRMMNGEIIHQSKINGNLIVGEKVNAILDKNFRFKYMKIHSAGHLLHDVFMTMIQGLTPIKGNHGSKAFLEYSGSVDISLKEELQKKVNEAVLNNLPIITKETSYDELVKECQFVSPNLPKDKPLRMIKIGDYSSMPDGGVHVKSTKEIGFIVINDLSSNNGLVTVKYRVFGAE